jgi:outer membrane protein
MQAEAQLASVDAQALNGQGLLSESLERFYLLTGLDKNESVDYKKEAQMDLEVESLENYLSKALAREDVQNKRLSIELSERELTISKGYHLPKLDLNSNYYFNKTGSTTAYRNSDWDLSLVLTIPLFEGGTTQARVRESVEKKQEAIYVLSDYEKTVKTDVTTKYETFKRYQGQIKAYDQALLKAKSSYDETLRDYRLGLVSNLDVLTSLNLYLDTKRNAERNRIQAVMTKKLLEASAGVLP